MLDLAKPNSWCLEFCLSGDSRIRYNMHEYTARPCKTKYGRKVNCGLINTVCCSTKFLIICPSLDFQQSIPALLDAFRKRRKKCIFLSILEVWLDFKPFYSIKFFVCLFINNTFGVSIFQAFFKILNFCEFQSEEHEIFFTHSIKTKAA